jgi:uncharacterized protein (DUF1330 family)
MSDEQPVFVVICVERVKDPELFQRYVAMPVSNPENHGGKLVARGRGVTDFTGSGAQFAAMMVQHWPSEQQFRSWQQSDAYQEALELRDAAIDMTMFVLPAA